MNINRRTFLIRSASGLLVTALAAACGGAAPPPTPQVIVVTATPQPTAAATPTAAPTAPAKPAGESLKGDARSDAPSASPTAVAAAGGKSEVSALWYAEGPDGPFGGTSKVVITVDRAKNPDLRVSFSEQEVGGSGPMWRAAGWMAVIMNSFLVGVDPTEYRFTYDVGGRVDGPSAGALMTIATVAATLGHQVREDAAMTGTINPDGTIGPVGGIPHKIDGAAAAKKKLVLIPAGERNSQDMKTKQLVDVIERGKRQGVEVKEVADIYEAYQLLTGKPLPKPAGMTDARPELPATAYERGKAKTKEWFTRYSQVRNQFEALPKDAQLDYAQELMKEADAAADKADSLFRQGLVSAAYGQAVQATLAANIAYHSSKVIEAYGNGGMSSGIAYLKAMQSVKLKQDAMMDRLQTQSAATLSDVVTISESYGNLNTAMGMVNLADQAVNRKVKSEEEAITALTEAVLYYAVADQVVELSKDSTDIGLGYGKAPAPSAEKVQTLSELFRRAAEANLNYFDSVVLGSVAQSRGMHPDVLKAAFAGKDVNYAFAQSSLGAMQLLKERAGGGITGSYATLGGALNSYVLSAGLIAKYYSLDAQLDKDMNVVDVANQRAMINMLDFAEKRSKELIGLASASGGEAVPAVLNFDRGKVAREGSVDEKFNALNSYWTASLQSEIVAMLSGKAKVS
jgi:hypothetical protein